MSLTPTDGLLSQAASMACEAGKIILPFFQNDCAHRLKADRSPVTEADMASHGFLMKALGELDPHLHVVSEESAEGEAQSMGPGENYWLIDPLDGTKSFLKGKPDFTVNIALMEGQRPVLGVVHAPAMGLTYLALGAKGAWREDGKSPRTAIRTRAARLDRLTVVASKDHSGPRVKRMLEKLAAPEVTSIGSSLKFCLVAEGRADLYFRDGPTMEWDTAAAQCVVEAAGGRVLDLSGESLRYGKPDLRNPGFVAVGDPGLRWKDLKTAADDQQAFRELFAEICRESAQEKAAR